MSVWISGGIEGRVAVAPGKALNTSLLRTSLELLGCQDS